MSESLIIILKLAVRLPYYTIPPLIIEKIQNFGKSFNQLTTETVKAFLVDSKKSKFKI